MGQKVNPTSLRLQINKNWKAKWFSDKNYAALLKEDFAIRKYVRKNYHRMGIADLIVERGANAVVVNIHTSKPGLVIGKGGSGIDEMRKSLSKITKERVEINIEEVKNPDSRAALVAENVALSLEKKFSFRRVIKQTLDRIKQAGAKGGKILVCGRLNGVEMARTEWVSFGRIPLQTLRADIDYCHEEANTTYGVLGVKVWIYKGDIFKNKERRGE
ncbi:30S ribosomal protein S3 [bacterium]|nr:30S ribosomal protein S3 [bacterium]